MKISKYPIKQALREYSIFRLNLVAHRSVMKKKKKKRIEKDKEKVNKIWKNKETKFCISQQLYLCGRLNFLVRNESNK